MSQPVARGLLVAACLAAVAGCNGGAMTSWRLQQDADSLASLATDGKLLANETAKGESTQPFTKVHAGELRDECEQLADVVDSAHPSGDLVQPSEQLVTAARRAAREPARLHEHPGDAAVARDAGGVLGDVADRAEQIAKQA
jgi:hypothetical protein